MLDKLLTCVVDGHFANMLSTDSRLEYFAHFQTPYMDTTGMCLELYYQMKSTAVYTFDKPVIWVFVYDEERKRTDLVKSDGENRTSWDRMFTELPVGFHQIVIQGRRSNTSYCSMSIDDVVVQPCDVFGEYSVIFAERRTAYQPILCHRYSFPQGLK